MHQPDDKKEEFIYPMNLYVMSDAPIKDVVDLLLQEPYTKNTITRNQDPEAYDISTINGIPISLDYGLNGDGNLDTLIFVPEDQEDLQRKIFESVKKLRYKATICEPPTDVEVVYIPNNPLPATPA